MLDVTQVEALARLARLKMPQGELQQIAGELSSVLDYVSQLDRALAVPAKGDLVCRNVLREDVNPLPPGEHTADLLAAAPETSGDYFKVKKILE